jgi:hypothetical protein
MEECLRDEHQVKSLKNLGQVENNLLCETLKRCRIMAG